MGAAATWRVASEVPPTTTTTTTTLTDEAMLAECIQIEMIDLVDVEGMTVPTAISIAESMCNHWQDGGDD
jgi:hypothetical protein